MREAAKELRRAWRWCFGALILAFAAVARGEEAGWAVHLQLVSEVKAIQPGKRFTVGLRLEHEPGFHTYWSNPGIVGVPTSLIWTLPDGFEAGSIQWPQPEVVQMASVNAYGYEGTTILLVEITAPAGLPEKEITLRARAIYMACATTCHPGFEDLELTLPVAEAKSRETDWDRRWHEAFEKVRATLPGELRGWTCAAHRRGDRIFLKVDPEPGADQPNREVRETYFFSTDNQVNSDEPQVLRRAEDGSLLIELAPAFYGPKNPKALRGILYASAGWLEGGLVKSLRIHAPLPDAAAR